MTQKERILIVEDEIVIALDLSSRMESMGYRIVGRSSSGRKAEEMRPNLFPWI